jgi:hypothetical protein
MQLLNHDEFTLKDYTAKICVLDEFLDLVILKKVSESKLESI